jgi:hypothetical protein
MVVAAPVAAGAAADVFVSQKLYPHNAELVLRQRRGCRRQAAAVKAAVVVVAAAAAAAATAAAAVRTGEGGGVRMRLSSVNPPYAQHPAHFHHRHTSPITLERVT